jgi:hypothetical protein
LSLQTFDGITGDVANAPEDMHAVRRRFENVRRLWKVRARVDCRKHASTVLIGFKKHVPDGSDRCLRPRATSQLDGVDADVAIEALGISSTGASGSTKSASGPTRCAVRPVWYDLRKTAIQSPGSNAVRRN